MPLTLNVSAIKAHKPKRLDRPDLEQAAVLVPVLQGVLDDRLVLTARHDQLQFQPSEISFPGGKAAPDEFDLSRSALRETEEEIGLSPAFVELIGELDQVTVSSRYLVSPFVGLVTNGATFAPGRTEVKKLVIAPVSDLLAPDALGTVIHIRDGTPKLFYKFTSGDLEIWGATARILKCFLELGYEARYPDVGL